MPKCIMLAVAAFVTAGVATARWLQVGAPAPGFRGHLTP